MPVQKLAKPVGVGIIGTGIGLRQVAPGFLQTGSAEIVGVCGSSNSRAEELTRDLNVGFTTDDYMEICESEDVDIVCVTTPNEFHVEHMKAALETGKHVFLEKPVGVDLAQTQQIASFNKNNDRLVVVGHQLRFNPYFKAVKEIVSSGEIGRVYHMSISQSSKSFANKSMPWLWSFDETKGGGIRLAIGVHLIDTARFFLGQEASAVNAVMDPVHKVRTPDGGKPREVKASAFFSAMVSFPETNFEMTSTLAASTGNTFDIVVRGERGDLTFDLQNKLQKWREGVATKVLGNEVEDQYNSLGGPSIFWDSFTYYAQQIVDAIQNGENKIPQASNLEDAFKNIAVLDAAQKSHFNKSRETINY